MKNAADEVLASEVLRRSIAPSITADALHQVYDRVVAGQPGPEQVRAKIIMVDTEDEASSLIRKLHAGADFATLARDFSKDGTAANGGDLGYATLSMLAPEIGSVAFALGIGQLTNYPVRSGNFWFIIKADGRTRKAAPDFGSSRAALARDVVHSALPGLKQAALRDTPIKIYGQAIPEQSSQTGN
jgi:peptidyl-prolyl cis-trans isomerase C